MWQKYSQMWCWYYRMWEWYHQMWEKIREPSNITKVQSHMLGYKTLETNVLELHFVYVGKPWSKHLV